MEVSENTEKGDFLRVGNRQDVGQGRIYLSYVELFLHVFFLLFSGGISFLLAVRRE